MKMVNLYIKTKEYSFTQEKNAEKIILYRSLKELPCFEKSYDNLYSNLEETSINIPSDGGDHITFEVSCILNCNVWPSITDDSNTATQSSASCVD